MASSTTTTSHVHPWVQVLKPIGYLFAHDKLVEDNREPVRVFELPWLQEEGFFGLYAPRLELWKQLFLGVTIDQILQVLCAIFIYKLIIPRRGTMTAYLLGWGVIIPLVLWIPFELVEVWDIQNHVLKMCFSQVPLIVFFRCIEAMYDTSPPVVEHSLANYMTYYTATIHHVWDPKTKQRVKVTTEEAIRNGIKVLKYFLLIGLSLSFLMHHDFRLFSSPVVLDDFHFNLDLLSPGHLANSYLLAVHCYFHLLVGFEMTNFAENLKGYVTKPTFLNPLWSSTSPTDFWGRKWNLMIHNILKYGAFLPAKKFFPTKAAVLISFIMSGLMHDYVWAVTFYHHVDKRDPETGLCHQCFTTTTLKLTAFFVWNGVVMLLERPIGKLPPIQWIRTHLPLPVVSTLVVLTALPVSHWYTGDWAVGGNFSDLGQGLWIIKKME